MAESAGLFFHSALQEVAPFQAILTCVDSELRGRTLDTNA